MFRRRPVMNFQFSEPESERNERIKNNRLRKLEADRCYRAGWHDMLAIAVSLAKEEGHSHLADAFLKIPMPTSGDK